LLIFITLLGARHGLRLTQLVRNAEKRKVKALLLIAVFLPSVAFASYRVHSLKVTEFDPRGRVLRSRLVLSVLDHLQWEHVHASYRWAKVELVDTWYCPGDTSRRTFCKKPRGVKTRGPASTLDKRGTLPYERQPVIP
jgi:hypothetical protein